MSTQTLSTVLSEERCGALLGARPFTDKTLTWDPCPIHTCVKFLDIFSRTTLSGKHSQFCKPFCTPHNVLKSEIMRDSLSGSKEPCA